MCTIEKRSNKEKKPGPPVRPEFVKLWEAVVKNGLDDEERKTLLEKFPPPENCSIITPPNLNLEIKNVIQEAVLKRDNRIILKQQKITACLAAIGQALDLEI